MRLVLRLIFSDIGYCTIVGALASSVVVAAALPFFLTHG